MTALARKKRNLQNTQVRKLITKYSPKSPISEQYRAIRTNLQFASIDQELRTIMVTSSTPGDGKSTTAANLAIVMAQQGNRVLLIDADLRKPTSHYTFRCPNTKGLTSVLTKQATLEESVYRSDIENLSVLTSGPLPPNPSELLSSKSMELLLESAQVPYDIVLIDTPPILAVTDAQVLAKQCDGSVLVVSSGKTEIDSAVKSKELLLKTGTKILGVILNRKKDNSNTHYYYYAEK